MTKWANKPTKDKLTNQMIQRGRFIQGSSLFALLLAVILPTSGCSEGTVPNSPKDEIEAAKFDPADAKNKGVGAAAPPE